VGIEGQLVDLAGVLVQASQLDARAVEIIENDLAISSGRRDMRAEVAVRQLYVLDA